MDVDNWLAGLNVDELKSKFKTDGALAIPELLGREHVTTYAELYQKMISGDIDASLHRHDLGSHVSNSGNNVPQIMWPKLYFNWEDGPLHERALALARSLLGEDMEFDFDMLIYKGPGQDHPFPWHQDEGYWKMGMKDVNFTDLRATSIWIALDDVDEETGCMWMVPGSHIKGSFEHAPIKEGHHTIHTGGTVDPRAQALIDADARAYPVAAGGAVLNTGRTLHYSGGNRSPTRSRMAYIANFRPGPMIELERQHGFDHGRRGLHNLVPGKTN